MMTYRPTPHIEHFNKILIVLFVVLFVSALGLIMLNNKLVNLHHEIASMKTEFQATETQNAETKQKLFSIFENPGPEAFATEHDLIQDKNPRYFHVDQQWSFASHF